MLGNGLPLELTDAIRVFQYLYAGRQISCVAAADADDNGRVQLTDGIYILNWLFRGGQPPPEPFPDCGLDTDLECVSYADCTTPPPNSGPNASERPYRQRETAVAVNPCDRQNIAVLTNQGYGSSGNGPGFFRAVSFDGGATWPVHGLVFDRGPETAGADPTLAFDAYGNLYAAYLGKNSQGNLLRIAASTDGGVTFPPALNVAVFDHSEHRYLRVDHPTIATGPSASGKQSVWVTVADTELGIVAVGAEVRGCLSRRGPPLVFTVHKVDACAGTGLCSNGDIAVGPLGEVLVTYQVFLSSSGGSNCLFKVEENVFAAPVYLKSRAAAAPDRWDVGFRFPTEMPIATSKVCGVRGGFTVPAGDGARASPALAWDHAQDKVYLAYVRRLGADGEDDDTDVYLRVGSGPDYHGWTTPVPVADSPGVQLHHEIAFQGGRLFFGWYGTGNDPDRKALDYFATYSVVGAVTDFKGILKVSGCSSASANPGATRLLATGNDYTSLAVWGGRFYPCWADNCVSGHQSVDVLVRHDLAVEDCSDENDNDGDGLVDCADPACCANCLDCAEDCTDGVDNDGDADVDCSDADCALGPVCPEDCDDTVDNDIDGRIDWEDPDCETSYAEVCDDALDNDGDGLIDCADPECGDDPSCKELAEKCTDGIDNDADGLPDCADPDCPPCSEFDCSNGLDDDSDGLTDCDDVADCAEHPACVPIETNCENGIDDDGDGLIDCGWGVSAGDPDCEGCVEICGDGVDNDGDGRADCVDPDCGLPCCTSADCGDGVDNDGDCFVDAQDPECEGTSGCERPSARPDCADGEDNDGDGLVDGDDPQCDGTSGCEQGVLEVCRDGVDNDRDGALDCMDDDCDGCPDCPEDCNNGTDDDGDGKTDCLDLDCTVECSEDCSDGSDNDGDGLADCQDPECFMDLSCGECPGGPGCTPGSCNDGRDNDEDGWIDCLDGDCSDPPCDEICDDGADNDGDGLVDCQDPSCGTPVCCEQPEGCGPPGVCHDGEDNDRDGLVDADDPDCANCGDDLDNDGDALADCDDPQCAKDTACCEDAEACDPRVCSDGMDNDDDGSTDAADADCWSCSDGEDNDGDGQTDCADSDCCDDLDCAADPGCQ